MRLQILGCSGGIGSGLKTTSMLLDDDVLIDAGTGAAELTIEAMVNIDHVFVTHCHLDHICCIPLLVDSVGGMRDRPLTVHAIGPTLTALRSHIFNNQIWPDFSVLPPEAPFLRFNEIKVGETVSLGTRKITPLPVNHLVPAVGYCLDSGSASLVFTGDTTVHDPLWEAINRLANLRYVIIETAFCERDNHIAVASRHLSPSLLAQELGKLRAAAEIYITHLKPGDMESTMREIAEAARMHAPKMLEMGQVFEF